jgi:hypothetical protein
MTELDELIEHTAFAHLCGMYDNLIDPDTMRTVWHKLPERNRETLRLIAEVLIEEAMEEAMIDDV